MTKAQSPLPRAPQHDDGDIIHANHFKVVHEGLQEKQAENRTETYNGPERWGKASPGWKHLAQS